MDPEEENIHTCDVTIDDEEEEIEEPEHFPVPNFEPKNETYSQNESMASESQEVTITTEQDAPMTNRSSTSSNDGSSSDDNLLTPSVSKKPRTERKTIFGIYAQKSNIDLKCRMPGCDTVQCNYIYSQEHYFFKAPMANVRRKEWLDVIGDEKLMSKILSSEKPASYPVYLCQKHFKTEDYIVNTPHKKILKWTAVPMPLSREIPVEHKGVQATLVTSDSGSQTDYTNMEHQSVQVRPVIFGNFQAKLDNKVIENIENTFDKWCDKFLPERLSEIIKEQNTIKHRGLGKNSVALGLTLFHTGPRALELLLSEDMHLPRRRTLQRVRIPGTTEYNEAIMKAFEIKIRNMTEREKYCSVIVDLVKIKACLDYEEDRIVGLHDINGRQLMEPAQYAVVILTRGLFVNWSQPIAFAFLSKSKRHSQVSKWIDQYIKKLLDIGLKVKTFVANSKTDLLNEVELRSISVDKPYFFVNDVKIYYMFDVPDMLIELRDKFLSYRFQYQKESGVVVATIEHVRNYLLFQTPKLCVAPKLSPKHLSPTDAENRQVRYAAQLLSQSVALALSTSNELHFMGLVEPVNDTIDFLLLMNNLFDTLNSSSMAGELFKKPFRGNKTQIDLLKQSSEFFKSLQLITEQAEKCEDAQFITGFQIMIQSLLLLFKDLRLEGHDCLFTRNLNLEVSKKMFKPVKSEAGGDAETPNSAQFVDIFNGLYLTHLLKPTKGRHSSMDVARCISNLIEVDDSQQIVDSHHHEEEVVPDSSTSVINIPTEFFTDLKIAEQINIEDIWMVLFRICLNHHSTCDRFKAFVLSFSNRVVSTKRTPDMTIRVNFMSFIEIMEKEFCEAIKSLETNSKIVAVTFERLRRVEFSPPCPCFPTEHLKKAFIRLRLFMIVNYNNKVYCMDDSDCKNVIIPSIIFTG
ncbi:uncharacterized protein LOC114351583 isoform X1 [Ostrinia furnacalis]|uniref:uncharacterized protein LOC114351583 isoform X1 n=2 Tax=Ostrinia furnacalis TaxID=93504 RepID=UPI001040BE13|nr:uncharacterized protein LOC114351583 isoform X1 [Ostrinia furnacalis]